ncbi:peptidoglycan-binding protein [Frankia sp. Cr1]|uniref:peptidoglycan-binding protein n=1 Tax=Frankia sp. Cr1 TaxID=3073931 RepID=UPI002AD4320C|nr:peptidoglycan-binding protein [Frankia sp. Cr1]
MTAVQQLVEHALAEVGYAGDGHNHTKYGQEFGYDGNAWCAIFVWCMFEQVGINLPLKSAHVPTIWSWARAHGLAIASTEANPGDQIIFDWTGHETAAGNDTHTGLVVERTGNNVVTVEGNVGNDQVLRRTWLAGGILIAGCVNWQSMFSGGPRFPLAPQNPPNRFAYFPTSARGSLDQGESGVFPDLRHPVTTAQNALNIATGREGDNRLLSPDGAFGPLTEKAFRDFQEFCRLNDPAVAVTGVVDRTTWRLLDYFLDIKGR